MKTYLIAVAVLPLIICNVAYSESCGGVIPKGGAVRFLSIKAKQALETLDLREFSQSSGSNTSTSGKYGAYSGSFSDNHRQSLQEKEFNWIRQNSDLEYALSSGDPIIVRAWENCMRDLRGGPVAWFESATPNDIYLKMKFLVPQVGSSPPTSVILDSNIKINPIQPSNVFDNEECLQKGYELKPNGCYVHLINVAPSVPLSAVISNGFQALTVSMPPRMHLELKTETVTKTLPAGITVATPPTEKDSDSRNLDIPIEVEGAADGWRFDDTFSPILISKIAGPGASCRYSLKNANNPGTINFVINLVSGNSNSGRSSSCTAQTVTYNRFRYISVPNASP